MVCLESRKFGENKPVFSSLVQAKDMNLICHELGQPEELSWFSSLGQLEFVVDLSIVNGGYEPNFHWGHMGTLPGFGLYTGKTYDRYWLFRIYRCFFQSF